MSGMKQKCVLPEEKRGKAGEYPICQSSNLIDEFLLKAFTKQKIKSENDATKVVDMLRTKAQAEITKINSQVKENIKTYVDMMAEIKAETKRVAEDKINKAKAETEEQMTLLKAQTEKKINEYTDLVTKIKAQAKETVAISGREDCNSED
ncbi:MAG: hypothetical protein ACYS71_04090 [Planctomycetota bacterium]